MFKKLKDKITEEVKQSPLKSVQQFASAVVSPSSSSVFEPSSNDHFCIDDCDDENQETPQNTPSKSAAGGFTTVNLHGQVSSPPLSQEHLHSRRSSVSSVTSDTSSLFPRYEPSSIHFQLQSDLESASEIEDTALSLQLERISKENLYDAYRKLRVRYNKYKGRFVDLAEHYRRLEKENIKCKNVLSETQDKALRRISELREQCNLEQEAKAHLEEALRSDLEEKDHLIATLNTKIELLKSGNETEECLEVLSKDTTISDNEPNVQLLTKHTEKVKSLEALLVKCKTNITEKTELIGRQMKEIESLKDENSKIMKSMTGDLDIARSEIDSLKNKVETLKNNEEEAALSLAENKLSVHQELEKRDEQIKKLEVNIEDINKEKDDLNYKVKQLEIELKVAQNIENDKMSDDKADFIQELSRGKSEAVKLMQQKLFTIEQNFTEKLDAKEKELEMLFKENNFLKLQIAEESNKEMASGELNLITGSDVTNGTGDILNDTSSLSSNNEIQKSFFDEKKSSKASLECQITEKEKIIELMITDHQLKTEKKESEIKELSNKIVQLSGKNNELQEFYKNALHKTEMLKNEIIELKESNDRKLLEKEEIEKKVVQLNDFISKLNSELLHFKKLCSSENEEVLKLRNINDSLTKKLTDLKRSENRISELQEKMLNKESEIYAQKDLFDSKVNEKVMEIKNLESVNKAIKASLIEKNDYIEQILNDLRRINKEKDLLQEDVILKQKEISSLQNNFEKEKQNFESLVKQLEAKILDFVNNMEGKEKLLSEKQHEIDDYKIKVKKYDEDIKILKNEIELTGFTLKRQVEEFNAKNSLLESLVVDIKNIISDNNTSEVNFLKNSFLSEDDRFHKIEEDRKLIISAICDLKSLVNNKESIVKGISHDLQVSQDSVNNLKDKLLDLESLYKKKSLSKEILIQNLLPQLNIVKEIKCQQTELFAITKSLFSSFQKDVSCIKTMTNELKLSYCKIEKEHNEKDKESSSELEKCKKNIEELKILLDERDTELEKCAEVAGKLKEIEDKRTVFETENIKLKQNISEFENEISSLKSACSLLKHELETEKNCCLQMEAELKDNSEKLNNELMRCDNLKSEILIKERDYKISLEAKDRELSSLIDELVIKDNKFDEELAKRDKEIENLRSKLKQTEDAQNDISQSKHHEILQIKEECSLAESKLSHELELKSNAIKEFESLLSSKDIKIKELKDTLNNVISEKRSIEDESFLLKEEIKTLRNKIQNLEENIQEKENTVKEQEVKCNEIKQKLETLSKQLDEINSVKKNYNELLSSEILKIREASLTEIETLKLCLSSAECKNTELLASLNELELNVKKISKECEDLKVNEALHCKKIFSLTEQLKQVSDSEQSKFEGKDELMFIKKENEELKSKFKHFEENEAERIKELIFDFNLKLSQKDEEIKSIESYHFNKRQEEEDFVVMELKQQIKDLQQELETRGDVFEKLLEEHKELKRDSEIILSDLKNKHEMELRDHDKKWRACLDRRLAEAEAKCREETEELSKEWKAERKTQIDSEKEVVSNKEELECSNRLAVAAVESSVNSVELLRKQVTALTQQLDEEKRQRKREVNELQRLLVIKKHSKKSKTQDVTVEDCTEMEYLRNILYEYMMGKEPLVLAKVLSAIVKFDADQTNKVLQKEEQKLSLLGQLGLS
ncbi:golgin subfamily A member Golgin-245 isoform X2 [Lycorma delicatula]|uniref:golgin subfamily A member Golgin-245 isoform X2 n=1 Tax=Lycorma delicatula TaxID=130591 RepID=UPI003F50D8A7